MMLNKILVESLFLAFVFALAQANYHNLKAPQKLSNCKAQLDDGSIIDLTSIDRASNPRSVVKDYTYLYNPCTGFQCDPKLPITAAVCQKSLDSKYIYDCGDQDSVAFGLDADGSLTLKYVASPKSSTVKCVCGDTDELKFIREQPQNTYLFTLTNKCCCPNKCNGKPTPPAGGGGSLSAGSILLIIFFSLLAAYFLGGFIFLKFFHKKPGLEAVPHFEFWSSIPGDTKRGFSFVFGKITGRGSNYRSI